MAGVGEASAVLSTIQIGFSLAKTLYACVGDYRSAREEIISLATDVEATLTQAQELDQLVASNESHRLLNERGLRLAEKCNNDFRAMVQKLLKLLTKAGVPERQMQAISLNDIDVSKFRRAAWVVYKPEVTVAKRELDRIRITMLIARSCVEAQSASNSADRDAAVSRIAGLERSRMLARRLLREAQAEHQKTAMSTASYSGVPAAEPVSTRSEPPPQRASSRIGTLSQRQLRRVDGATELVTKPTAPASFDGHVVERVTQQVEKDEAQLRSEKEEMRNSILKQLQQDESDRKAREAAETLARDQAVEAYKADVRRRLTATRERSERMRTQLLSTFSHELDDSEVQDFIETQNSQELKDDFVSLMIDKYKAPVPRVATSSTNPDTSSSSSTIAETAADNKKGWLTKLLGKFPQRHNKHGTSEAPNNRVNGGKYVHILLTLVDGKRSILALENTAFSHTPCGPDCNISQTTKAWLDLSEADQIATFKHLVSAHPLPPYTHWHLHSAWSTGYHPSRRRRFLERVILREHHVIRNCSYILAFSAAFSWQEMLKEAADRGETVQTHIAASGTEKTAVRTVANPPAQVSSSKVLPVRHKAPIVEGEVAAKHNEISAQDRPAFEELPQRASQAPLEDGAPSPGRHSPPKSQHGAKTGVQAALPPPMPSRHNLPVAPYTQPPHFYAPALNPFPPMTGIGQSSNYVPALAATHGTNMPEAPYTGSTVPNASNYYPYNYPHPYAPAPYSHFGQLHMPLGNPFGPGPAESKVPTNGDSRFHRGRVPHPQTERPRRRRSVSTSRRRWLGETSDSRTSSIIPRHEVDTTSDDSRRAPKDAVKIQDRAWPEPRIKTIRKRAERSMGNKIHFANTATPAGRRVRRASDDPPTSEQSVRRQPIRLPWHTTRVDELHGVTGSPNGHDKSGDGEADDALAKRKDDDKQSTRIMAKYTHSTANGIFSELQPGGITHDTDDAFASEVSSYRVRLRAKARAASDRRKTASTQIQDPFGSPHDRAQNGVSTSVGEITSDGWEKGREKDSSVDDDFVWRSAQKDDQKNEDPIKPGYTDFVGFGAGTAGRKKPRKKKKKKKNKRNGKQEIEDDVVDFHYTSFETGRSDFDIARVKRQEEGESKNKARVVNEGEIEPMVTEVTSPPQEPEPIPPPVIERRPTVTIEEAGPESADVID